MVFGEIVEPSTRALIYDDEDTKTIIKPDLLWKDGNYKFPERIHKLLVAETHFVIELLKNTLVKSSSPSFQLQNADVKLYELENEIVVCTCNYSTDVGQIAEKLIPFIHAAKSVYALTSSPSSTYQSLDTDDIYFVRALSSGSPENRVSCPELPCPNIVTGLCASIMTLCKIKAKPCELIVTYTDLTPLDSMNSAPLLGIFKQIHNGRIVDFETKPSVPSNNLYT